MKILFGREKSGLLIGVTKPGQGIAIYLPFVWIHITAQPESGGDA